MIIDDLFKELEEQLENATKKFNQTADKIGEIDLDDFFRKRDGDRDQQLEKLVRRRLSEKNSRSSRIFMRSIFHGALIALLVVVFIISIKIIFDKHDTSSQPNPLTIEQPISKPESSPLKKL